MSTTKNLNPEAAAWVSRAAVPAATPSTAGPQQPIVHAPPQPPVLQPVQQPQPGASAFRPQLNVSALPHFGAQPSLQPSFRNVRPGPGAGGQPSVGGGPHPHSPNFPVPHQGGGGGAGGGYYAPPQANVGPAGGAHLHGGYHGHPVHPGAGGGFHGGFPQPGQGGQPSNSSSWHAQNSQFHASLHHQQQQQQHHHHQQHQQSHPQQQHSQHPPPHQHPTTVGAYGGGGHHPMHLGHRGGSSGPLQPVAMPHTLGGGAGGAHIHPGILPHPHMPQVTGHHHPSPNVRVDVRRHAFIVLGGRRCQTGDICKRVAEDTLFAGQQLRHIRATLPDGAADTTGLAHPLVHLDKQLKEESSVKPPLANIVVDDCLVSSVFEAYYYEDIIKKHYRVDTVFYLDYTLDKMSTPEDPLDQHSDRIYHPLGFEVGSLYESAGAAMGQTWLKKVAPYHEATGLDKSAEEIAKEIATEIKRSLDDKRPSKKDAELAASTPIKGMTIVRDFALVCQLRQAVLPYVDDYCSAPSPQLLMEYANFTRFAHQLRSYMITHALVGGRGCLVGFKSDVYFLASGSATFMKIDAACIPSALQQLLHAASGAATDNGAGGSSDPPLSFVLDVTCCGAAAGGAGRHVIYVSDMLYLREQTADKLTWAERQELLARELPGVDHTGSASHPGSPLTSVAGSPNNNAAATADFLLGPGASPLTIAVQRFWKPDEIDQMLACPLQYAGIIFASPGTLRIKQTFAPTNYFWPKPEYRKVEVRIWNGRLVTETDAFITKSQGPTVMWLFDAYVLGESGTETKCDYPVYISEDDVTKEAINDGNIVEVYKDTYVPPVAASANVASAVKGGKAPTPKASSGAAAAALIKAAAAGGAGAAGADANSKVALRFHKRNHFSVFPMSSVFVSGIWDPTWSLEGLARVMRTLKFMQRSRRRDELAEDADMDRD